MIYDHELETAKTQIIEQIKEAKGTIAGALIESEGVRAFVIGGANSLDTATLAFALQDLVNNINKRLLIGLGEDNFEKLQAKLLEAKKIEVANKYESREK